MNLVSAPSELRWGEKKKERRTINSRVGHDKRVISFTKGTPQLYPARIQTGGVEACLLSFAVLADNIRIEHYTAGL